MAEKSISNSSKKDVEEEISSFMSGALILWVSFWGFKSRKTRTKFRIAKQSNVVVVVVNKAL